MELLNTFRIMHRTIILTGDIHCSVIHRYGPLYELTSSSLTHSMPDALKQAASLLQVQNRTSEVINVNSFGILDLYKNGPTGDCKWDFYCVDKHFEHYLSMTNSFWNERRFKDEHELDQAVQSVKSDKERKFVRQSMQYLYKFNRGADGHMMKPQFAEQSKNYRKNQKKRQQVVSAIKGVLGRTTKKDKYDMKAKNQVHIAEWYVDEIYPHNIREYNESEEVRRKYKEGIGDVQPYDESQASKSKIIA
jgi:hypothetical protein